jgi:hypothetical protein
LRRIQPLGRFRLAPRVPVEIPPLHPSPAAPGDTCPAGGDPVLGPSEMPYRQLHLRPLAAAGVNATGVRIGILDTGFDTQNPAFSGITITAQHDFVFGDSVVRNDSLDVAAAQFHGTATWSLFAGDVAGRLRGIARGASYLLAKTEDIRSETRLEEDNYVAALEWADSIGVDIVSSSLGYLIFDNGIRPYSPADLNGDVAVTTIAADSAARRGILECRTGVPVPLDPCGRRLGAGRGRRGLVGSRRVVLVAGAHGRRTREAGLHRTRRGRVRVGGSGRAGPRERHLVRHAAPGRERSPRQAAAPVAGADATA